MLMPGGAQGNQASTGTRQARSAAVGAGQQEWPRRRDLVVLMKMMKLCFCVIYYDFRYNKTIIACSEGEQPELSTLGRLSSLGLRPREDNLPRVDNSGCSPPEKAIIV